jgi:hypothetical protein
MEMAGNSPVPLDYIRGHGCKYKTIRSCKSAATRIRRGRFKADPIGKLNPDTIAEYRKLDYEAVWGIYNADGVYRDELDNIIILGGRWSPAIYLLVTAADLVPTEGLTVVEGRDVVASKIAWHGDTEMPYQAALDSALRLRSNEPLWEGLYPDAAIRN